MADSVYISGLAVASSRAAETTRHSALVRITHWISSLAFFGLVVSGVGILLAHPRFYWGETGGLGAPSLFDLPLPFMLGGPSGWGRYLHFESAWLCVLTGACYLAAGLARGHFRKNLLPTIRDLGWPSLRASLLSHLRFERPAGGSGYNALQRISYTAVIFVLLPLIIWTGLAMSPAIVSVFPVLVTALGGHQCARTIHFFAAIVLVIFFFVHVVMVWRAGFRKLVMAMITGRGDS
jgi:thiosulfate reductase cytochrome b subunit